MASNSRGGHVPSHYFAGICQMLKLALIALFMMSVATLAMAASSLPIPTEEPVLAAAL